MKFTTVLFTVLAASSTANAYWWKPAPTPTRAYPQYPTPTPTPSGHPHHPKPDDDKPKHKQCLRVCFQEKAKECAPGWKSETTEKHGKKCNTCCKEAGGKDYKRNMGQVFDEWV